MYIGVNLFNNHRNGIFQIIYLLSTASTNSPVYSFLSTVVGMLSVVDPNKGGADLCLLDHFLDHISLLSYSFGEMLGLCPN